MTKQILRRFLSILLAVVLFLTPLSSLSIPVAAAASGNLTGLSNDAIGASYTATDDGSNASWSANGNTITGSVIGTAGMCSDSHYETTLTITNNKSATAVLSFNYTIAQNSGTIQVAGKAVTANGSYSGELASGDSVKIYLKSGSTSAATSINITGLNLLVDTDAATTFQPSENGSYTVDGQKVTEQMEIVKHSTQEYTLSAAADSGYKFIGWYSVLENKYLSSDAETTLYFDSDQTITAIFTEEENPVFDVSGAKFTDLNEADQYAADNGLSKIVLVSDGTLKSGSYSISSGVILLIPFDAQGTCYTTAPANTGNVRTAPSVYKTLTMEKGASITVNGAISVSAKHYAYGQNGAGAPDGKYGYIYMNDGSEITVNNGGAIYVYGFVSGNGTVNAKSGATVYENMQICDFRGGSATSSMNNNKQKIFPLNQYFIQNIEAELNLESGADEYIYTSIYASNTSTSTAVHFIGNSNAMFSVEEGGNFTKKYLPDKDRLEISVNGNAKINNLTLTVMGISISSGNYVLPITNCMTLNVNSGTTQITQDVALLAGVQVNIADEATVQVTNGSSMYVYDQDEWTKANYASNAKFKTVLYSPTRTYTRKAVDLIDARIDVNGLLQADGYVYTTAGGADITSTDLGETDGKVLFNGGAGTETETYMYKDYTTTYDTIPINSAKLHNGSQYAQTDEEYTLTDSANAGDTYYWDGSENKWKSETDAEVITITFDANGGEGEMEDLSADSKAFVSLTANAFTREGYTFIGWNTAADGSGTAYDECENVTLAENTTLYAQWSANTYTVTWVDEDGTELEKDENVTYGSIPEYNGETPAKEGDEQYSYTFTGWTPEITEVTGDVTYKAVFEQTLNQYTITWKNWDGAELLTEQAAYGEVPSYSGETPVKEGDEEYSYFFSGWTPEITEVTGDAEYTAVFTDEINTYTVTWMDEDGTVLETDENVEYGVVPEYNGATPSKEGDAQYRYTFSGWTPTVDTVNGDITYTAVYEQSLNQYTVTWKNWDGTELQSETIDYGKIPVYAGETPVREGDAHYRYTFRGWDSEITEVVGDVVYTAEFEEIVNTYTVTWVEEDGTILETDENVEYGSRPEYNGETPVKEEDEKYRYTFSGWTPEITEETMVEGDVTYTALYEKEVKTYTVTWTDEDGTVLSSESVAYGTMPVYKGETPTKESDGNFNYTFDTWTPEVSAVTGDVTYQATYISEQIIKHIVTFDANGGEGAMEPQIFVRGVDTQLIKNTYTRTDYTFTGWNTAADGSGETYADEGAFIALEEDITLYAQWRHEDGWFTDQIGKTYYQDGELQKTGWTVLEDQIYYLNPENGYAAADGVYWLTYPEGYGPDSWDMDHNNQYEEKGYLDHSYFIFDEDGVFQSNLNGMKTLAIGTVINSKNGTLYSLDQESMVWMEKGEIPWHPGLVCDETDYYYFPTDYFEDDNVSSFIKGTDYYVSKSNDLSWPEKAGWGEGTFLVGKYSFDDEGKLILRDGFTEVDNAVYYYVNGVKTYAGLIQIGEDYYYVNSSCMMVTGRDYYVSKTNGLLPAGTYRFGNDGKMVMENEGELKNGIVKETEDLWYYYVNGMKVYAGLIEIDGDYYYVNSSFQVIHGKNYFISKTNGLLPQGTYEFAEDGKMIQKDSAKNGIIKETEDLWYYYVDGVKTYAGLIEINGDYYYVNSSFQVIHGRSYYVSKTNGLFPQGSYTFGEDGKMEAIDKNKNGIVKETEDLWYYYVKGVKTYAGLIEIDGNYYYVNTSFQVIHGQTYFISKTNGLMEQKAYEFDEEGKMIMK